MLVLSHLFSAFFNHTAQYPTSFLLKSLIQRALFNFQRAGWRNRTVQFKRMIKIYILLANHQKITYISYDVHMFSKYRALSAQNPVAQERPWMP